MRDIDVTDSVSICHTSFSRGAAPRCAAFFSSLRPLCNADLELKSHKVRGPFPRHAVSFQLHLSSLISILMGYSCRLAHDSALRGNVSVQLCVYVALCARMRVYASLPSPSSTYTRARALCRSASSSRILTVYAPLPSSRIGKSFEFTPSLAPEPRGNLPPPTCGFLSAGVANILS